MRRSLQEIYHYRRLVLVLGMLGDKEREKVVGELAPLAAVVVITKPTAPGPGTGRCWLPRPPATWIRC